MRPPADRLAGLLLGTAVGDAIGLPREGLAPAAAQHRFGGPPLSHRLLFGRGMVSDDTEHTCLTAEALLLAPERPDEFARVLAWRLRWWLLGLPAGIGRATLRACLRLWLGRPPDRSGVRSAGNGPAMRAAVLGAALADRPALLRDYVRVSTRLTHQDPRAEQGALLVALAAREAALGPIEPLDLLGRLRAETEHAELLAALDQVQSHLARHAEPAELAAALGMTRGISGYVVPTVAAALFCWLRHPNDFRAAVEAVVMLGGDSDTTSAIVGGLAGAAGGASAIPADWLEGLWEWPRSVTWMRELAARLAAGGQPPPTAWWLIPARNLVFLAAVLAHGFRRILGGGR